MFQVESERVECKCPNKAMPPQPGKHLGSCSVLVPNGETDICQWCIKGCCKRLGIQKKP